MKALFTFL